MLNVSPVLRTSEASVGSEAARLGQQLSEFMMQMRTDDDTMHQYNHAKPTKNLKTTTIGNDIITLAF